MTIHSDHLPVYGDVPTHPVLSQLKRMEDVEREHGSDPDALIPRFVRWWNMKWGKFWGL